MTHLVESVAPARKVTPNCRSLVASLLAAAVGLSGCAGSSAPKSRTLEDSAASEPRPSEDLDEVSESPPQEEAVDPCADGTCFTCGANVCLDGWYCDETAPAGKACSWLPDCAKPSCACVLKVLGSGCSCEEPNGAPHVTCT